ncbi:MAG: TIGR02679 family protein [Candidatus Nanopelagicales bacterium]
MSTTPSWIANVELAPVWQRIQERYETIGLRAQGTVGVPITSRAQRHALGELLGRSLTADRARIDLAALDERLRARSGVGGLAEVLTEVFGVPPRDRRAARDARRDSRERPLALAAELVDAPWAGEWIAGLRSSGLLTGRPEGERAVREAAVVIGALLSGEPITRSRVELGARLLGDAHALDQDRMLHQVVLRALAAADGAAPPEGARGRERLWTRFGVEPDLLSRTCLTLGLRSAGHDPGATRLVLAAEAGDPVHLTQWDLRRVGALGPMSGATVLVCENPRVVEAIAERGVCSWAVVCTAGESNLVVDGVLSRLSAAGARLRYHGDFDWAGIAIANRVVARFQALPLRMTADDYLDAVRADGPPLLGAPVDPSWSAELGAAMRFHARAVHEESVLDTLIDELADSP